MQIIVCFAQKLLMIWDELLQDVIRKSVVSVCNCLHIYVNAQSGLFRLTKTV